MNTSDGFTQGGWLVPHMDEAFIHRAAEWLGQADALLLGRRTYDALARDWHTLTAGTWNPTTILSGDVAGEVVELKQQPGRDLQIHGSARLAQSLLAAGLIDELRLVVAPVIVGHGRRLFPREARQRDCASSAARPPQADSPSRSTNGPDSPDYATYSGASDIT